MNSMHSSADPILLLKPFGYPTRLTAVIVCLHAGLTQLLFYALELLSDMALPMEGSQATLPQAHAPRAYHNEVQYMNLPHSIDETAKWGK